MRLTNLLGLLTLTPSLALACGGEVVLAGSDGGGPDSGGSSGGGSGGSSGADSSTTMDAVARPETGITCAQGPGSGSGGSGSCEISSQETCSDGTTYIVSCSCPVATCSCSEASGNGGGSSGAGVTFTGCPQQCSSASLSLAYAACGFPVP